MARSINTILQQEKDAKNAQTELAGLNSPSNVAVWLNMLYIHAVSMGLHEQAWDIFISEIESKIAKAGAGSLPWIRDRILEFQAGDNVQYSNGVIAYPLIDTIKQIITRCSVFESGNRVISVKVAKSDPPAPLSSPELTELTYYLKQIHFAGTQINIVSLAADQLYVEGNVEYDGQYSSVIQSNVVTALNNYCTNLSSTANFNGFVTVNGVEDAIQGAAGVKNVKLTKVAIRANSQSFGSGTTIYDLSTGTNLVKTIAESGYVVGETTTGHTFNDSIVFMAV